ncbi:MFS transporter [Mycobacteroides salmoniphilum]|uniref:MFS transporter n=1 Tax=Mycobacteroides salmoniphilum TaxID=404941 RepID=UPI0010647E10|nr:MFS transporter [Mycobacteroides salmoniphilum]TDZ81221.1 Multidrug transporter MdfA [Mycobacteroides salmoniphilum]TDZ88721.1 Multidrug transporter MdfA [Mycobacteroides salmoniphilum]
MIARLRRSAAFILLAFSFSAVMIGTTMPTPMYALYSQQMHFSVLTTTVVYATYAAGVLFALLLFGGWSDVLGRRPLLLTGAGFAILSSVIFLFVDSVPLLLIARIVSGLSAGFFTGAATVAVIEAAPEQWRGRAAAVATIANTGGLGLGPLVAGILVQYAPWPTHLAFIVHIGLVSIAVVALLLAPETAPRHGRLGVQRLSLPPQVRATFAAAATAGFAGFAALGSFTAVAPGFLSGVLGIDNHAVAGASVFLTFGSSCVAQILVRQVPAAKALILGCAVLLTGMLLVVVALHTSSLSWYLASAVVVGVGQGISFSRGLASIADRTPEDNRAEVTSSYFVVAYVGIALPVIGEGLAAHAWGLRTAGITFALAVAALAALCLIAVIWQERPRRTESTPPATTG